MKKYTAFSCIAFCLFFGATQCKASDCGTVVGNLVTNCGFETGSFSGWSLAGNDVPGALNNLYGVEGVDPLDGISPNSGLNQAFFADLDSNATTLSQGIVTTAGDTYTISFYVAQDTTPDPPSSGYGNELMASFGGASLASLSNVGVEGYTEYTYITTATSGLSTLDLTFGNGLGEFLLDDVSVVQTPEPSAWILMLTGLVGLIGLGLRGKRSLFGAS